MEDDDLFQMPGKLWCKKSKEDNFYKKEKVDCGRVETSKFRTKSGWVLRCIAWPHTGGRSFIHIPIGEDKQRCKSFIKMLGDFKDNHEYKIWFSTQTMFNTIMKQPNKSMKGSYVEIAKSKETSKNSFFFKWRQASLLIIIIIRIRETNA